MKTIDEQFENQQDYSQNELSATELTAGVPDYDSIDDESDINGESADDIDLDDDTDMDDDTDLEDDEPILNDDDNEEYGTVDDADAAIADNIDE